VTPGQIRRRVAVPLLVAAAGAVPPSGAAPVERVEVRFVDDEAAAALAILELRAGGAEIDPAAWRRLLDSEGYVRLKRREAAMNRAFTDEEFRAFMMEPDLLARAGRLRETLEAWRSADLSAAGRRALAYLPANATIRAKVYPSVKPRSNSFVFELDSDPAIFLYLDPEIAPEKLENTVAHELHHVGFGTTCPSTEVARAIEERPEGVRKVLRWQGAFGEGLAMLAAAGAPEVHPHASSSAADRARWDRDVARFDADARRVDAFFLELLDGRLDEERELETARSFYGVQGPWYTVGWRVATDIERAYGREALIAAFCDPRRLLPTHARALAATNGADSPWSPRLLAALADGAAPGR